MDEALLLRYLKGTTNELENSAVELWCCESSENRRLLEQYYYTTFVGDRLDDMESLDVEQSLQKFKARISKKEAAVVGLKSWSRYAASIAAFFIGVIVSGAIFLLIANRGDNYTVMTESGEQAQVLLPDSTKVWINSSTHLSYHTSLFSSDREVSLTGEAFFKVAKNKRSPFIVNTKNVETKVYGTEFNVRAIAEDAKVTTTLYEGSVGVSFTSGEDNEYRLKPGDQIDVDTKERTVKLTVISTKNYPVWMRGKFHFEQTTLLEIALTLEKHYNVKFIFKDASLERERFTCDFYKDEGLEQILAVLKLTQSLDFSIKNKSVYLFKSN